MAVRRCEVRVVAAMLLSSFIGNAARYLQMGRGTPVLPVQKPSTRSASHPDSRSPWPSHKSSAIPSDQLAYTAGRRNAGSTWTIDRQFRAEAVVARPSSFVLVMGVG